MNTIYFRQRSPFLVSNHLGLRTMKNKRLPFFCRRQSHKHDNLIAELMREHDCANERQLRSLLATAYDWAEKHDIQFTSGIGSDMLGHEEWFYDVEIGQKLIGYRVTDDFEKCTTYARLVRASLALMITTHPTARREVELQRKSRKRRAVGK